jgi:myo-inositol-1(or 4)-monophosphatase
MKSALDLIAVYPEAGRMTNELLEAATRAAQEAGRRLPSIGSRPSSAEALMAALRANDEAVAEVLRPALTAALPGSGWNTDEHGSGPMPGGDWWVVDPVGGNLNAVYGMADWNIGVSLVRDGRPVLAVLHAPVAGETFTAAAGEGAFLNGVPVHVSDKTDLSVALAGTGQAKPDREPAHANRAGAAIAAMMRHALYVRVSVPVGHQLTQVAAGRMDLHWQFDNLRSHIAPVLIVREAGATVTDLDGKPWQIGSAGYLAAAAGLHAAALTILQRETPMRQVREQVTAAVTQAGEKLLDGYATTACPANKTEMGTASAVRSTVPSTFPLLDLAAGHVDAYWQYECDLIGVSAGALLATEAGGVVTDLRGQPWQPGRTDILAAAPGVHKELLALLRAEGVN